MTQYYVYVLRCADGSLYTGYSTDVDRRYACHRSGRGAKYTRSHPPVSIAAVWRAPTKSDALRFEHAFKQLAKAEKERLLVADLNDPAFLRVR